MTQEGCHIYAGRLNDGGYAIVGWGEKVARLVLAEKLGRPIRPGYCALHNCPDGDNPACINPDHLWEGTVAENNADMRAKGRHAHGETHGSRTKPHRIARGDANGSRTHPEKLARGLRQGCHTQPHRRPCGERHGSAKLTEPEVFAIRASKAQTKDLMVQYNISRSVVQQIRSGRKWKHLPLVQAVREFVGDAP